MLREAGRVTRLARLLQLSPAWGSPDVAEGRSLHPGHGKSPAPLSSPNCLGQKSCLGAASRAPQHPETPRGNGSFLPRHVPDPQPCEQVHGRVPPHSVLLRDQQKPLAERLASRNLYGEAVGSERSRTPSAGTGAAGRTTQQTLLARSPNPARASREVQSDKERSHQYVSPHKVHGNRRHLSSLLLFPVPGAVAETHAQNQGEPHQPRNCPRTGPDRCPE